MPPGLRQTRDDRIRCVIVGGGIGDESGHGQVPAIARVIMPMASLLA